jgi:acetyl esterase/lipase
MVRLRRIRRVRRRRAILVTAVAVVALVALLIVGRIVREHRAVIGAPDATTTSAPSGKQTLSYGSSADQAYDVWPAQGVSGPAPLVMFVHGGGWTSGSKDSASGPYKASYYPAKGYVYASINYRLVPSVTVEDEAGDVAAALKSLLDHAAELGIDPGRVVIMGHSAGAHLVALVGTDESYLAGVGLSEASLRGVVAIDGAAYDVPTQVAAGGIMHDRYLEAFGSDRVRQLALSPTAHAAGPNAPAFLLPHVQRPDGIAQADELAAALQAAGTRAEEASFPGTGLQGHAEINRRLGDPTYAETPVVDAWLAKVFA